MQRRAAAAYLALFLVVSAGAYAVIGVAEKPEVELDAQSYGEGDRLTVDGREYDVTKVNLTSGGGGGGHGGGGGAEHVGTLEWTDSDATETLTLENNTNVTWQTVTWNGREIDETTLDAGSSVQYNGSVYRVQVNASADPPTMTLAKATNESINVTYAQGDAITITIDGQYLPDRTVREITQSEATLAVGDDYRLVIPNESNPDSAQLIQQFNVTRRLVEDPTLENRTYESDAGERFVRNKTTDATTPLDDYLPPADVKEVAEGDTLVFEGNETTIDGITADAIQFNRTVSETISIDLEEGASITLGPNDREYFVHFPADDSVQIVENTSSNWETYQAGQTEIDNYKERMSGLWGVVILAFLAALLIGAAAYLPVKD